MRIVSCCSLSEEVGEEEESDDAPLSAVTPTSPAAAGATAAASEPTPVPVALGGSRRTSPVVRWIHDQHPPPPCHSTFHGEPSATPGFGGPVPPPLVPTWPPGAAAARPLLLLLLWLLPLLLLLLLSVRAQGRDGPDSFGGPPVFSAVLGSSTRSFWSGGAGVEYGSWAGTMALRRPLRPTQNGDQ
jgi:hypothetical protein